MAVRQGTLGAPNKKNGAAVKASPSPLAAEPVTSLERADLVLETLAIESRQTLAQIVHNTGIPRSSAHRLLEKLVGLGWLCRVGSVYQYGSRLFEINSDACNNHDFLRMARPHLEDLHRRTGLAVHLAYLDGADVIYWERLAVVCHTRVPTRIGGRLPAYRTAVGKMLLSGLDRTALAQVRRENPRLTRVTETTLGNWDDLEAELARARQSGVAHDRCECFSQFECVAAPILRTGSHLAAVSLTGAGDERFRLRRGVQLLTKVAADLSREVLRNEANGALA